MKREGHLNDVTMGPYDGPKVCELVGIFMLTKISEKFNKSDVVYIDFKACLYSKILVTPNINVSKTFNRYLKHTG